MFSVQLEVVFAQDVLVMILSRNMLKRVVESRHPCRTPTVDADFILLHGCPQSCMSNPVEGLLEVYENMLEVLLVLEIFLTEDS